MGQLNQAELDVLFDFLGITYGEHKNLLAFLIKKKVDLSEFMFNFYEGDAIRDIIKYQRYRREKFFMDIETFDRLFLTNNIVATETIFQEPLNSNDIELLNKYQLSHIELYNRFCKNPIGSFVEIVRSCSINKNIYSDDFLIRK